MKVKFSSVVTALSEKHDKHYMRGVGKEAEFRQTSRGWFVKLANSYESLFIGLEKPNIKIGDIATITFEFPDHENS